VSDVQQLVKQPHATPETVKAKLPTVQSKYRLTTLELVQEDKKKYHVLGKINPGEKSPATEFEPEEEAVADSVWEESLALWAKEDPTAGHTRLSTNSADHIGTTLSEYIVKSPAGPAAKAAARTRVALRIQAAQAATDGDRIYERLREASSAVMDLYPIGALSLQVHHEERVADNPATFPRTRYQRIRARVNARFKKMTDEERNKIKDVPARVAQIAREEFEQDLAAKPAALSEVNMVVLTVAAHLGSGGVHQN
jgi:hypothetical protein